jgi:mannose-6-phosphate isomerase-like protein (cupin superfamily)
MARPDEARAVDTPLRPPDAVNPRLGEQMWFDGDEIETRMIGRIGAHSPGPPLHLHRVTDETLTVKSGRVRFTIEGRVHELGPGDSVEIPRGVRHRFENPYDEDVWMVGRVRPGIVHEIAMRLLYGALARPRPNPLELAVAFHDGDNYPGAIPLPIARAAVRLLYGISSAAGVAARFRSANLPASLASHRRVS